MILLDKVSNRLNRAERYGWSIVQKGCGEWVLSKTMPGGGVITDSFKGPVTALESVAQAFAGDATCIIMPRIVTWEFSKNIPVLPIKFSVTAAPDELPAAVKSYAEDFNRDFYAKAALSAPQVNNYGESVLDSLYAATNKAQGEIFQLASALRIPELEEAVGLYLDGAWSRCKVEGDPGYFAEELFFGQDDTGFDHKTLNELVKSDCPSEAFSDALYAAFADSQVDAEKSLDEEVIKAMEDEFGEEMDDIGREAITNYLREVFDFYPPYDHYIKAKVPVMVVLDTGDSGSDFTLNDYVEFGKGEAAPIDERASLVWLANSQGYTKEQLEGALALGDMNAPHGFLETCRVEMANAQASRAKPVVLLVSMSVGQMLALCELKLKAKQGGTDLGSITLSKDTEVGLFDFLATGSGGPLEIELEKDITIPVSIIHSAKPDKSYPYSILDVYAAPESIYRETLLDFQVPADMADVLKPLLP